MDRLSYEKTNVSNLSFDDTISGMPISLLNTCFHFTGFYFFCFNLFLVSSSYLNSSWLEYSVIIVSRGEFSDSSLTHSNKCPP